MSQLDRLHQTPMRRCRIVCLPVRFLTQLLRMREPIAMTLKGETSDGEVLPDDVVIVAVHADWASRSIELLLESPSFPEVRADGPTPSVGLVCGWFDFTPLREMWDAEEQAQKEVAA
jgi:hypothetical protein